MKRKCFILLSSLLFLICFGPIGSQAQSQEVQQLLLNVDKLAAFKKILQDMKKGYTVVTQGYQQIKGIAAGDFQLHQVFLDGLLKVSPAVKSYPKVGLILTIQVQLLGECKKAVRSIRLSEVFDPDEQAYLQDVLTQLLDKSQQGLLDLMHLLTPALLRMSDEERLSGIDRLCSQYQDMQQFVYALRQRNQWIIQQRLRDRSQARQLEDIFGLPD